MNRKLIHHQLIIAAVCTLLLFSCSSGQDGAQGGLRAWIDIPRDQSVISLSPHQVIAHASNSAGVQVVELLVNGELVGAMVCENPANPLVTCSANWNPPAPGDYRLEVRATAQGGTASLSSTVIIKVGKAVVSTEAISEVTTTPPPQILSPTSPITPPIESPTPSITTSSPTWTPTFTSQTTQCPAPPNIPFFDASPATILIGQSTTLSWGAIINANNVTIDQGIGSVSTPGQQVISPNTTTTYLMTATGCGGTVTSQVTVRVKQVSPSDTPIPTVVDTQGPPAPQIVLPANNAVLPCSQNVKLTWQTPADPSGIVRYRVRLQVTSKANPSEQDWSDVKTWDPLTATLVNADNETTCGGFYRWRVVAYDGAGNQGKVSAWALFSIAMP